MVFFVPIETGMGAQGDIAEMAMHGHEPAVFHRAVRFLPFANTFQPVAYMFFVGFFAAAFW